MEERLTNTLPKYSYQSYIYLIDPLIFLRTALTIHDVSYTLLFYLDEYERHYLLQVFQQVISFKKHNATLYGNLRATANKFSIEATCYAILIFTARATART